MQIRIDILNPEKCLIGLDYEIINFSDHLDENKRPIIDQYDVITIGLLFVNIVFTHKRKQVELEGEV